MSPRPIASVNCTKCGKSETVPLDFDLKSWECDCPRWYVLLQRVIWSPVDWYWRARLGVARGARRLAAALDPYGEL